MKNHNINMRQGMAMSALIFVSIASLLPQIMYGFLLLMNPMLVPMVCLSTIAAYLMVRNNGVLSTLEKSAFITKIAFITLGIMTSSPLLIASILLFEKLPELTDKNRLGSSAISIDLTYSSPLKFIYLLGQLLLMISLGLVIGGFISQLIMSHISIAYMMELGHLFYLPTHVAMVLGFVCGSLVVTGSIRSLFALPHYQPNQTPMKWLLNLGFACLVTLGAMAILVAPSIFLVWSIDPITMIVMFLPIMPINMLCAVVEAFAVEISFRVLFTRYCMSERVIDEDHMIIPWNNKLLFSVLNSLVYLAFCYSNNLMLALTPLIGAQLFVFGVMATMLTLEYGRIDLSIMIGSFRNFFYLTFPELFFAYYEELSVIALLPISAHAIADSMQYYLLRPFYNDKRDETFIDLKEQTNAQ